MAWVLFVKATFSGLNLKPDDGFLFYNMFEAFDKTGHPKASKNPKALVFSKTIF